MAEPVYRELLNTVVSGTDLTREQAHAAFMQIMGGQWSEAQIAGLLVALRAKGETVAEFAGASEAMRAHAVPIDAPDGVIDTCGTGGTGLSTFNVSTAVAFVAAGAGATVAKHGNRTHTRVSGSADVLEALGVNLDATPETISRCLREAGVGFCYAIKMHPAMRFAGPVRKQLGVRTIFNIMGPLTNPAGAKRQVMGIFDPTLTDTIARVLGELGAVHALVVHGEDGLDELSITSVSRVSEYRDGHVRTYTVQPEDFGLHRARMEDITVDSPQASADAIRAVLAGREGPARDIVLLNAAAALTVAGKAKGLSEGIDVARESLDSGSAGQALESLITISNG